MELRKPNEEFKAASELVNISLIPIEAERARILNSLYSKYCKNNQYTYPLWEHLRIYTGVSFPFAWSWFDTILANKEVLLFFELQDDERMFQVENGSDIPKILEESYRFNFYVSNKETSFLLAYNDHENLIATGEAIDWLCDFLQKYHPTLKVYNNDLA